MKPPSARDLFARVLDIDPENRDSFLAAECGGNAELLLEVQRLLVDSEKAQSFFSDEDGATIAAEDCVEATYTEGKGDVIGRYKLLERIGEGGGGVVYMADQTKPVKRRVALKVIKLGMDTRQVVARFEAERQALAMMEHPNIAKILDAGATESGRPYFVMELVRGIPITTFCDENKLGTRERLEIFMQVCAAVQHAHQKGIIHRDLKPGNVLVTMLEDRPISKVIDFGIAKATQQELTEKTLFTQHGHIIGTPAYMSPEQASMTGYDIDTRSDIYALGVLLYELLAGAPPFDHKSLLSAGYNEMRRIIAEDEPPKPSTRCTETQLQANPATGSKPKKFNITPSSLKGELDWVVMKAIEKDRTRRYETANAFAADIGRYLSNEPVQAVAASAAYKFRKFARRNKATFAVTVAMVALLLAGIATTTWQAVRATAESERATEAEKKATENLALMATERDAKTAALEDAEAISNFLTDMFVSSQPGQTRRGREVKVVDLLDPATAMLEADQTIPTARRVNLQDTFGKTYSALGLPRQSIPLQEKVRDYYLNTIGLEHPDTLGAMNNLANSYNQAGRRNEALKMHEAVLHLRLKVNGPKHLDTLKAMTNLALSYSDAGRRDEALELQEKVLTLSKEALGAENPETLNAMHNLSVSYDIIGPKDKALPMLEELLFLRRKVNGAEHPDTLKAMNSLALSYYDAGRRDEALKMQEDVLLLRRKVLGPEHPQTLTAMNNLANSYGAIGHRDKAVEMQEKALKMREEVLALDRKVKGPTHPGTLGSMTNLAISYASVGHLKEAVTLQEEALALKRRVLPPNHPFFAIALGHMAFLYENTNREEEAKTLRDELAKIKAEAAKR